MSNIDNRIVEMSFENKGFEKGIEESSKSLENFNKALQNTGNSGGGFSALGSIADSLHARFSAFGTMATGALMRIGSAAVDAGIQLVKSLSFDQIMAGFQEYELKINSIKIMLAGGRDEQGLPVTLELVKEELEKLNVYADKTIYSFKDMTQNIGKFTNAGVDLKLAVASIKGIANVAAVSGANTEQAARAMYNFAQALSAGYVKYIDWKSIENAQMATVEFKEELMKSAVAAGTLEDAGNGLYRVLSSDGVGGQFKELIGPTKLFNQSLKEQWMTSEVLTATLDRYSDETTEIGAKASEAATKVRTFGQLMQTTKEAIGTGWGMTFEWIFGDYEKATDFWTGISDRIQLVVQHSAYARNRILKSWDFLGGRDALIEGLYSLWDSVLKVIQAIKNAFGEVFPGFKTFGKTLSDLSKNFRDFLVGAAPTAETLDKIKIIFKGLFSGLALGWKVIASVFKGLVDGIKAIVKSFSKGEGFLAFLAKIATFFTGLKDAADKGEIFTKISEGIAKAFGWLGEKFQAFIQFIKDAQIIPTIVNALVVAFNWLKTTFTNLFIAIKESETIAAIVGALVAAFEWLKTTFTDLFIAIKESGIIGVILQGLGDAFNWLKDVIGDLFAKLQESEFIKTFFDKIKEFFVGMNGIDTSGIVNVKDKLVEFFTRVKEKLAPFKEFFSKAFDKIKEVLSDVWETEGLDGFLNIIRTLVGAGVGGALIKFLGSVTGVGEAGKTGLGIAGILKNLSESLDAFQKNLNAKSLLTIAAAIGILVISLLILTLLDQGKMAAGVAVITGLFIGLSESMILLNKIGNLKKVAGQMLLLAGSVLILSFAMLLLKDVNPETIISFSIILGELILAAMVLSNIGDISKGLAGLLAMAAATVVLAIAAKIFGKMDPAELQQGLIAIGALMLGLVLFAVAIGNYGGNAGTLIAAGAAMLIMTFALLELVGVVAILAQFDPAKLGTGLVGLGAIMLIMVAGMSALADPKVLLGAAAMMILALAVTLFVPAIAKLGRLPIETIVIGLLAIAGIFAVLGLAGYVLGPVLPVIIGVAAAVLMLGVAMLAAGTGMMLFGTGLTLIAAGGVTAVAVLVFAVKQFVSLIPFILTKIGEGIIALAVVIGKGAPAIMNAIGELISAFLALIAEKVPEILQTIFDLISAILALLVEKIPEFVEAGLALILGLIEGLIEGLPPIVAAIYDLIIALLGALAEKIPDLLTAGADLIIAFVEGIGTEVPRVIEAAFDTVISFINGLADSIRENTPLLLEAVANLCTAFIDGVKVYLKVEEGESIAGSIITGLINGIKNGIESVVLTIKDLGEQVLAAIKGILGIKSPSAAMEEVGQYMDLGLISGISNYSKLVVNAAEKLGEDSIDGFSSIMSELSDILSADMNLSPVITPVLNLNPLTSEVNSLNGLLSSTHAYDLALSQINADNVNSNNQNGSPGSQNGQTITNQFNLNGLTIRSEADIEKLARELYRKQEDAMRSRGIKPSYSY